LEIEEPILCGDCASFDFHPTLPSMLGSTLIRYEVVEVRSPSEKRLVVSPWMMQPCHHEELPVHSVVGLIP
jgi:hypothetical protein